MKHMSMMKLNTRILGGILAALALRRCSSNAFRSWDSIWKYIRPVVTPQDADEAADDVRNDGGAHSGLKADERRFIGGGTHIRRQHIQLPTEVRPGVFLVVLQNPQHIPAGCQLLVDGGDEPGQLALDQLHSGP